MVSGPLRRLLPKPPSPTDPMTPFQTPSSAIPSTGTPSSVPLARNRLLVVSHSGHDPARGASQTHLSCSTRYLETFTERSRRTPSSMIRSDVPVLDRTKLAVASSTAPSLPCCLLPLISWVEVWGAAGRNHSVMVATAGGGSLRVGRAPLSTV